MHLIRTTQVSLLAAALTIHAFGEEDVSTETSPVTPAAETKPLTETLDPTAEGPLPSDLPAEKKPEPAAAPSENVTINLIHRLVEKGILTKEEAETMIKQAEADAATMKIIKGLE